MDSTAGDGLRWRTRRGGEEGGREEMSTLHYRHFPTCAVLDVRSSRAFEHVHKLLTAHELLTLVHELLVKYIWSLFRYIAVLMFLRLLPIACNQVVWK